MIQELLNIVIILEFHAFSCKFLFNMKENTKGGTYGFAEQHSTAYYASAWMHPYGAFIINDKAEPGLNSQQMIESLAYHKQFIPYMPADGEFNTVTTLFKDGKAHSTIGGPCTLGPLIKYSPPHL